MARFCSLCDARFEGDPEACPLDGAPTFRLDSRDRNLGRNLAQRYTLVEVLGTGGMGTVYRARQRSMDRDVAVKLLKPERMNDPDAVRRFFQEARAASRLTNPHVITLHEFGQAADGQFFLVMELLVGRSLGQHRAKKGGRLPFPEAIEILDQVLEAIEEAHRHGVIHRDLKPDNIFLLDSPPQFVKVLDFGLARLLDVEVRASDPHLLFGTPAYMSPEQAKGKVVDHRSDLYSLGVILFELLAGQLPFQASSSLAILLKKFHRAPPRLSDVLGSEEVPPSLDDLVARLLATDPNRRPPTASETRRLLAGLRLSPSAETRFATEPLPPATGPEETARADTAGPWTIDPRSRTVASRQIPILLSGTRREALQRVFEEMIPATGRVWWLYQSSLARVRSPGARGLLQGMIELLQTEQQRLRDAAQDLEKGDSRWLRATDGNESLDPAGLFDTEVRRSPEEILADRDLQAILEEAVQAERRLKERWEAFALDAVGNPDMDFLTRRLVRCRDRVGILAEVSLRLLGLIRGAGVHSLYMRLAGLLPIQRIRAGETLFQEGETGDAMVVLIRGQMKAFRGTSVDPNGSIPLAVLNPGDLIGEMACLDPAPRSATVVAYSDADFCLMDQALLAELRRNDPLSWMGVLRTVGDQMVERIRQAVATLEGLQRTVPRESLPAQVIPRPASQPLQEEFRDLIRSVGRHRTVVPGQYLWREGDAAWGASLVLRGSILLHQQHDGLPRQVGRLEEGTLLGPLGLLDKGPRLTSAKALGAGEVVDLDRTTFQLLLDNGHATAMELLFFLVETSIRHLRLANDWVAWLQRLPHQACPIEQIAAPLPIPRPLGPLQAALVEWGVEMPGAPQSPFQAS